MNKEEITAKKQYVEDMVKQLFIIEVSKIYGGPSDTEMAELIEDAFQIAEFFYTYKRGR